MSDYVPPTDDNGIRKAYTIPSGVDFGSEAKKFAPKYPWETIKIGECFEVLHSEMKEESLRPLMSRMGKKFNKRFLLKNVESHGIYVVGCFRREEE